MRNVKNLDYDDAYPMFIRDLGADTLKNGVPLFDAGNPEYMKAFIPSNHTGSLPFW